MTWYVVCCDDDSPPDKAVWTVSRDPEETGWETDNSCSGYGLTRSDAQFLADAANEKEAHDGAGGEYSVSWSDWRGSIVATDTVK